MPAGVAPGLARPAARGALARRRCGVPFAALVLLAALLPPACSWPLFYNGSGTTQLSSAFGGDVLLSPSVLLNPSTGASAAGRVVANAVVVATQGVQLGSTTLTSWPTTCADAGHKLQFSNGGWVCGCEFGFTAGINGACTPPASASGNSSNASSVSTISVDAYGATVVASATLITGALSVSGATTLAGVSVSGAAALSAGLSVSGATALTGDLSVGSGKFSVAAASGSTVVAGNLTINGTVLLLNGSRVSAPPGCTGSGAALQYNSWSASYSCVCAYTGQAWDYTCAPASTTPPTCAAGKMASYVNGAWTCVPIVAVNSSSPNGFYLNTNANNVYQCTGQSYLQYDTSALDRGANPWGCYGPTVLMAPPNCNSPGLALNWVYNPMTGSGSFKCVCVYTGVEYDSGGMSNAPCVAPTPVAAPALPTWAYVRTGWHSTQVINCTNVNDCQSYTPYGVTAMCSGVCQDSTGVPLSVPAGNVMNLLDGDTSTCAQFTNDHCYTYDGVMFGTTATDETRCDAYVTIDLGANYSLTGMTIYGSTGGANDLVSVFAMPITYVEAGMATPGKFGNAAPPYSMPWAPNGVGAFSSKEMQSSYTEGRFCCGGTTGVSCPATSAMLTSYGACKPPFASATQYQSPPWTDSTTAFRNGYTLDFNSMGAGNYWYQNPSASMLYTRYITIAVNVGVVGSSGSTKLNLCEVQFRGKVYTPEGRLGS